jgi:ABC-type amino acid transport substrate-binding protein
MRCVELRLFIQLITVVSLLLFIPSICAQTLGASSGKQKEYVGLNDDAYPISYRSSGVAAGYCVDFFNALKAKHNIEVEFKFIRERFIGTSEDGQQLDAECGPHTITQDRVRTLDIKKAQFSKPFAWTGAKIIIKNEKIADFNNPLKTTRLRFGVSSALNPTTTFNLIQWSNISKFTLGEITIDRLNRPAAVEKLKNGELDAYANDGILLRGILSQQKDLRGFSIIPNDEPLSREAYGIVVYESKIEASDKIPKNRELLNTINSFITENEFQDFEDIKIFIPSIGNFSSKNEFQRINVFNKLFYSIINGDNPFLRILAILIMLGISSTIISLLLILLRILLKSRESEAHNPQIIATPRLNLSPQLEKTLVIVQILKIVQDLPREAELPSSESSEVKSLLSQLKVIVENEEELTPQKKIELVSNVENLKSIVLNPEVQQAHQESEQNAVELLKTIASALPEAAKILESLTGIAKTLGIN